LGANHEQAVIESIKNDLNNLRKGVTFDNFCWHTCKYEQRNH